MKIPTFLLVALLLAPVSSAAEEDSAPYIFSVAKLLADEGSFREALAAYERAVEADPDDPYIRAEYTKFLTRLGQLSRSPRYRQQQLEKATEQAAAARRLAGDDLDVLRVVGDAYLTLADLDPRDPSSLDKARFIFETMRRKEPNEVLARLSLGQIYTRQQRLDLAVEIYREALAVTPSDRRIYGLLVDALLRTGRTTEAEEVLRQEVAYAPDAVETWLRLAELMAQRGAHEQALSTLRQGPPELMDRWEVKRFVAFQLYLIGDLEGSLELTEKVLESKPEPALRRLQALLLSGLGRNQEAVDELRGLLEKNPEDGEVASALSRILQRDGQDREALTVLKTAAERLEAGTDPEMLAGPLRLEWMELHMQLEEWKEALEVAAPLTGNPDPRLRLATVVLRAEALMQLDRGDEALKLLEQEQGQEPANVGKRAELLMRLERVEEARQLIDRLAASGDEDSVVAAALVFQRQEYHEESTDLLEAYLEREERSTRVLFMLGVSFERRGLFEESVGAFRRLLEVDPDVPEALNYLGYMWADRGENLEEALELIRKAVSLDPENGAYVDSLGWVHYRLGNFEEAVTQLERARQLTPGDGTVLEHLGDAYKAAGRGQDARAAYLAALQLDGVDQQALLRKIEELVSGDG